MGRLPLDELLWLLMESKKQTRAHAEKNIPEVGGWRARGRGQAGREKKQMKNYVARWQKDEESSCLTGT